MGPYLLLGYDMLGLLQGNLPDRVELRDTWQRKRAELMDRGPGRRPWAWWELEAPAKARKVYQQLRELPDLDKYKYPPAILRRFGLLSPAEVEARRLEIQERWNQRREEREDARDDDST